jgi:hypothetical protein
VTIAESAARTDREGTPTGVRIEIVDRAVFPDSPGFLKSIAA